MSRATGIGLFILFQALYALTSSGNAFRTPDEFEVYFQTEHLIDAGDLSVPQANEIRQPVVVDGKVVGTQSVFFGRLGIDGKPYAPYGPFAAVLAVPHHLAGRALAAMMGIPRVPRAQGLAWVIVVGGITMLATATAAALAVVGFYRASLALGTPDRTALLLRFYENHSLRDVGAAFGVSEDTAQKRVQSALEKLAEFFKRRGFKTATVAAAAAALQNTATTSSATLVGARAAGQEADMGTVAVGKLANLIVLAKNPLDDIGNVRSISLTVKRGREYPRTGYRPIGKDEVPDETP